MQFMLNLYNQSPYYRFQYFSVNINDFKIIAEKLKNKSFFLHDYGWINKIENKNPYKVILNQEKDLYKMQIDSNNINNTYFNNTLAVKDDTVYIISDEIKNLIDTLEENELKELVFKEQDLELFTSGIMNIVKENIEVDEQLKDKIIIGSKPIPKIYLDYKDEMILCDLKLDYNKVEINYFETKENIVRDKDEEEKVLTTLLSYGFNVSNDKIYIDNLEEIGAFLEAGLEELAKTYEVFTTSKLKETNIIKNNSVTSNFKVGKDNIMKYEFDLGEINNNELLNVLETMRNKKRYYKLKSGNILDLNNNESLLELDELIRDLDLANKEIKEGSGEIPKYRAIYLDIIKKSKYNIIKTNNLFDELINNFNSYKNVELKFSKKDKEILRDYQIIGIKWLYNIYKCGFGGILADEMGLGKSIQLIYFIKQIIKEKNDAKILIVAPTSLIYNWKNEFDKFGSELKYKVYAENKWTREKELESTENVNILITTYGLLRQDLEKYQSMGFELVAIDEAQNIKNINTGITKAVKSIKANTKVALTGTPLENSVLELWSIFDFIMPGYLASLLTFGRKYNIKETTEEELSHLDNLNKQIKPFILRRKKKDVVKELPPKIENVIYVDLNNDQKRLYMAEVEKTKKEMDEILASEGFTKGNFKILQLLTKLRQLCISPTLIYENYKGSSAKIEGIVKLIKDIIANGHKILVFTSFKKALDMLNIELTNESISAYVIDGSVSSKKRMELVDRFNEDDTNVFLITLKSGGTGLNLTSADVVIHLDLWWNPQVENQATDRAHRIGQDKTVEVIKLIASGTIEERILELQNKKKILSDKLIESEDIDTNIISKLTEEDIKNLISIDNEKE